MVKTTCEELAGWINALPFGEGASSYSGRAMYGKRCVSVTISPRSELSLGLELLRAAAADGPVDDVDIDRFITLMDNARADNMGRDIVVYWPDVAWTIKEDDACPGCGCEPGDGVTEGCTHPEGCGHWADHGEEAGR